MIRTLVRPAAPAAQDAAGAPAGGGAIATSDCGIHPSLRRAKRARIWHPKAPKKGGSHPKRQKVLQIIPITIIIPPSHHRGCPMFVCLCSGITDHQIRAAAASGCDTLKQLRDQLEVGTNCGKCLVHAAAVLREERSVDHTPATRAVLAEPVHYWPQPA